MKVSAQEKIAELESRIAALEHALLKLSFETGRRPPTSTTVTLTSEQHKHFFAEMGKLFR